MTKPKEYDLMIPLHLIPVTIAQRIRERGGNLYRISVVRTHQHHYTVKCKCRAKIAMEPVEHLPDRPVLPGPGSLSLSSGGTPEPEQVFDIARENPVPEPLSCTSSGNPGSGSLSLSSGGTPEPEQVFDIARENPVTESISGQQSTVEDNA